MSGSYRTPAEQATFELIHSCLDRIGARERDTGYASLTVAERTVYLVWWLEAEVLNGGFDQYFFNSACDHAAEAAEAFERIGAVRAAAIVRRAVAAFGPGGPPAEREGRGDEIESISHAAGKPPWEALDDEFYAYPDNIEQLLGAYVRTHLAD